MAIVGVAMFVIEVTVSTVAVAVAESIIIEAITGRIYLAASLYGTRAASDEGGDKLSSWTIAYSLALSDGESWPCL
ncbi:uncharacterized protein K489DRAFT_378518 [Dissoconium aciculare CBS 342.82]|uniref:Uncharacterized protein n=1 Tax=Dissoconium aciculare CBS 342.82 TaxID=1314786 RepID=A0A6J3M8C7_9PEZI|nr:uncharacterized protein K489DRAFT_378518 [Dissoconium aciculare CBS 342.82]KAF1824118.1 hypothetical protein K489DRAFT_378518 [Dissoconium aciculare CBS 342.82]